VSTPSRISDLAAVGAPATWVLSNHDETRHVTRYGRAHTGVTTPMRDQGHPSCRALGTRRARATAAGPAWRCVHLPRRGLGLYEVEDLPAPASHRTGPDRRGVPLAGQHQGTPLFGRASGLLCAANFSDQPVPLPREFGTLLASGPLDNDGLLPTDSTVWLHRD
jgi:hypothetical protein